MGIATSNDLLTNSMIGSAKALTDEPEGATDSLGFASPMPLYLDRIDWMPSPPLAPDDGPIDIIHLRRMTLGDASLEREVLTMFSTQASRLVESLAAFGTDAPALTHTLKGSARAIGAFAVGDAAAHLETEIKCGGDTASALSELDDAVIQARCAIDAILRQA